MKAACLKAIPAKSINWKLHPVGCDGCDKPLPRPGVTWTRGHREHAFVSLPYVLCSECLSSEAWKANGGIWTAVVRRAKRHSAQWGRAVQAMLMNPEPSGAVK